MSNPSNTETQRQAISVRVDVRALADAHRFLQNHWNQPVSSRSDLVDWAVVIAQQLFTEVSDQQPTESFEEAYRYLEQHGIGFDGSDRTKKIKQNNLAQENIQGLLDERRKPQTTQPSRDESLSQQAKLANKVYELRQKHPEWEDRKLLERARQKVEEQKPAEREESSSSEPYLGPTDNESRSGPVVRGSSEGTAGIPENIETTEEDENE
jgi:hypothetical protein